MGQHVLGEVNAIREIPHDDSVHLSAFVPYDGVAWATHDWVRQGPGPTKQYIGPCLTSIGVVTPIGSIFQPLR